MARRDVGTSVYRVTNLSGDTYFVDSITRVALVKYTGLSIKER